MDFAWHFLSGINGKERIEGPSRDSVCSRRDPVFLAKGGSDLGGDTSVLHVSTEFFFFFKKINPQNPSSTHVSKDVSVYTWT